MLPRASGCQSRLYETSVTRTRRHQVNPLALLIAAAIPMSSVLGASYSAAALFIDVSGLFVILWVPTLDFPPRMGLSVVWIWICSITSLDLFTWGLGDQSGHREWCLWWVEKLSLVSYSVYVCVHVCVYKYSLLNEAKTTIQTCNDFMYTIEFTVSKNKKCVMRKIGS